MIQGASSPQLQALVTTLGAGHGLHLYISHQQTNVGLYQSEAILNLMYLKYRLNRLNSATVASAKTA